MYDISTMPGYIPIGNQRDFGHSIQFDLTAWAGLNADDWKITYTRPGEAATYPVPDGDVTVADNILTWTISEAVTAINGTGSVIIEAYRGGEMLKHSDRIMTIIGAGHEPAGEAPDPVADWIADATSKLAEVDRFVDETIDATEAANAAVDRANAIAGTLEGIAPLWANADISVSALGEGAAPTASITQDETGTSISLGIPKGDTGAQGIQGEKGDGYKPKGQYLSNVQYEYLNVVTDGGSSYAYIHPTPAAGIAVSDTSHWQQIAAKGDQGIQGETGATAYDMAALGGYSKTEAEFYTDLATLDNYYPNSWGAVQNAVRAGSIDRYFAPGDQFAVTKGDASVIFEIADITDATKNTAAGAAAPIPSTYFDSFPNAKPVTLVTKDVLANVQFSAQQANYKVLADIPAGAANITLTSSAVASGVATAYDLTVPEGGFAINSLLRIKDGATNKLLYYATPTSAPVEISLTPGATNTPLVVSPAEGAVLSAENNKDRVDKGSNNYSQSAVRQWLNSALAKGTFWAPQSVYDLPPSWNATLDGFLKGLDADFLSVIGATKRITANNTVTDGGSVTPSYTLTDRFFLPSRKEIFNEAENGVNENTAWPLFTSNAGRIKYLTGAARIWWSRSPTSATANLVRYVRTDGTLGGSDASNALGAAAACVIL